MEIIKSKDNPFVKRVVSLVESKRERVRKNAFVIEGVRFCREAILSGARVHAVIMTEEFVSKHPAEAKEFSLTVSCDYNHNATAPLKICVYTGINEKSFDTVPYKSFALDIVPDTKIQQTFTSEICAKFMRVVVENTDSNSAINNISINVMLKN